MSEKQFKKVEYTIKILSRRAVGMASALEELSDIFKAQGMIDDDIREMETEKGVEFSYSIECTGRDVKCDIYGNPDESE